MDAKTPPRDWFKMRQALDGPDWRWQLASKRAAGAPSLWAENDELIRNVVEYCRAGAGSPEVRQQAAIRYPDIAAARQLNDDTFRRDHLKLLVLADCPRATIATRLSLAEEVIRVWEQLWFDVRLALKATDWIALQVIRPEQMYGSPALAAQLKLAYLCGQVAAFAMIDFDCQAPVAAGERLFQRQLKLHLKCDEAMDRPLSSAKDCLFYVKLYSEIKLAEKRLELQRERLTERCREAVRKHERALERLRRKTRQPSRRHKGRTRSATTSAQQQGRQNPLGRSSFAGAMLPCGSATSTAVSLLVRLRWADYAESEAVSSSLADAVVDSVCPKVATDDLGAHLRLADRSAKENTPIPGGGNGVVHLPQVDFVSLAGDFPLMAKS